jgi:hypothetical protein
MEKWNSWNIQIRESQYCSQEYGVFIMYTQLPQTKYDLYDETLITVVASTPSELQSPQFGHFTS